MEEVAKKELKETTDPSQEEEKIIKTTNSDKLTIKGIKFSNNEKYRTTRNAILNKSDEGLYPTKEDIETSYRQLEEHVSADKLVAEIRKEAIRHNRAIDNE